MTNETLFALCAVGVIGFALRRRGNRRSRRSKGLGPLDDVLFTWPTGDAFTVRDLLRSIEVKGITGSGKSSGSIAYLLDKIVAHPRSTLLLIAQKPEDRDDFVALFAKHGKPLRIVEPGGKWRCNFIKDELAQGQDDRALTDLYVNQGESLQDGLSNGGDNAKFFRLLEDRILIMSFGALRMAGKELTPANLRDFLATAAYNDAMLTDAAWQKLFHNQVMQEAARASKSEIDANDFLAIKSFFTNEFVHLDEKPRSGAISGLTNTAFVFSTGQAWKTCATDTTCPPSVIEEGVSVLINYPASVHGPTGKFIAGGFKYKWEKYLLRRKWDPSGYFCVIACDEFQESYTEFDARFIAQSRSHGGCLLTATQTTSSELAAAGGKTSRDKINALSSNYGMHIFHLADPSTAAGASKLVGKRLEAIMSGSPDDDRGAWDELAGRSRMKYSFSQSYQDILKPRDLLTGLRTGGPPDYEVDGVVIRVGVPFQNGENFQFVAFKQPGH